jgi:acyl carrier protein
MIKLTEQDVLKTIQKALGTDGAKVTLQSKAADIESWDSLGHLGILASLDKTFEGKIAPIEGMAAVDSVPKILELLKKNSLI